MVYRSAPGQKRPRRPGLSVEQFLDEINNLHPAGLHFVLGYVARHVPAWIRHQAIAGAKSAGYGK